MTSSSTPRYFPKRKENLCSQNYLYMNVYIFIQNSSKQEGTQMPFNCWEDKQSYVHTKEFYIIIQRK